MNDIVSVSIQSLSNALRKMARMLARDCSDIVENGMVRIEKKFESHPEKAKALYDSNGNRIEL